jgi:hypothetical protein
LIPIFSLSGACHAKRLWILIGEGKPADGVSSATHVNFGGPKNDLALKLLLSEPPAPAAAFRDLI